jgi:hypothetical protein
MFYADDVDEVWGEAYEPNASFREFSVSSV